ncbi:MAG: mechanosensitive ion channel family protein [Epulopiscium sp.]|nr:mechanosensitive ion channel family protein [Candidatus Epulonipiscium sp.]
MIQWIEKLQAVEQLWVLMKDVISLLFIVLVSMIIKKIGTRMIRSFYERQKNKPKHTMSERKADTLTSLSISLLRYFLYFIIGIQILSLFGVSITSVLTIAGVGGVAIGFGAQSLVKDIISGFFILLEDQFGVGDIVTLNTKTGTVEEMGLRTTRIRSFDGDLHIIPNGEIGVVTNSTRDFKRAIVDISISYEENIERVIGVLEEILAKAERELTGIISTPQILGVQALGEYALVIRVAAQCQIKENWGVERELRKRIKQRFDEVGIVIPYPKTTIYMGTEIKGQ